MTLTRKKLKVPKSTPWEQFKVTVTSKDLSGVCLGRTKREKKMTSKKADQLFSAYIRARDKKCVNCGKTKNLTCSHFWGRMHSATRYDEENCDTLCWLPCHYTFEHEKHGDYRDFKIKQLGEERYAALEKRARSTMKRSQAIQEFLTRYAMR